MGEKLNKLKKGAKAVKVGNYTTDQKYLYSGTQRLSACHLFTLGVAISFISIFVLISDDAYDISERLDSTIKIRVYGEIATNYSDSDFEDFVTEEQKHLYKGIWDQAFYVMEAANDEVFIITNFIVQPMQKLGICADSPFLMESSVCQPNQTNNNPCAKPYSERTFKYGHYTGRCVESNYTYSNSTPIYTCEVKTWCPVINQIISPLKNSTSVLKDVLDSTVIISSSVNFPQFKNASWKHTDLHCQKNDRDCPIHDLKKIIQNSNTSESEEMILSRGATLTVNIDWNCRVGGNCKIKYNYQDVPNSFPSNVTYKYLITWHNSNERTLYKMYGIKLRIAVTGRAKEFRYMNVFSKILTYTGILSIISIAFSFIVDLVYPLSNQPIEAEVKEPKDCCKKCPMCLVALLGFGSVIVVVLCIALVYYADQSETAKIVLITLVIGLTVLLSLLWLLCCCNACVNDCCNVRVNEELEYCQVA